MSDRALLDELLQFIEDQWNNYASSLTNPYRDILDKSREIRTRMAVVQPIEVQNCETCKNEYSNKKDAPCYGCLLGYPLYDQWQPKEEDGN
jgi:hypothetical protein